MSTTGDAYAAAIRGQYRSTAAPVNGVSPRQLCGWRPDPKRIASFRKLNGTLAQASPRLLMTEPKDVYLWLALMAVKPSWQRGAQKIGDCYAAGTHVLGPDAVKNIEDVKVGDRVYAGDGSVTEVITTQVKTSYKPLLTIHTTGGIPLTVTEDHQVLAYRFEPYQKRASGKHKRMTKRLYEREVSRREEAKRSSKWQLDRPNSVIDTFEGREAQLVEAKDLRTSDYLLCPVRTEFDRQIPDEMLPYMGDPELRWLIGLFLGDGYASEASLEFACTSDEREVLKRLWRASELLDLDPRIDGKKSSQKFRRVRLHSTKLSQLFRRHFYDGDKQKALPSWAICGDVVEGLIDADGHRNIDRGVQHFDSISPSLAHGVRLWAINEGLCPTMKEVRRGKGSYGNAKPLYRVSWQQDRSRERLWRDDDYLAMPITKIEVSEGPHTVYDIGVKHDLHTFYANGVVSKNCVAWGSELAATMLMALQHIKGHSMFLGEAATEPIYGGCRVEALGKSRGGWSDGAFGAGAAKWVRDWGVLLRKDYSVITGNAEHDVTSYSGQKAKDWGNFGCGGERDNGLLDKLAQDFPVQHVVAVDTVEEAAAAIENGYVVTIASMAGFGQMRRNADGVCKIVDQWAHQMMWGGVRWFKGRPQFRTFQSWGPASCSGPDPDIEHDAISGCSWWTDTDDAAWILRTGDNWVYGDIHGLPEQKIDLSLATDSWYQPDRNPQHVLVP